MGSPGAPTIQLAKMSTKNKSKQLLSHQLEGSLLSEQLYHFNHPICLSFDVKQSIDAMKTSNNVPIILFQVYSIGLFNRHRLEGYSYYNLSDIVSSIQLYKNSIL